MLMNQGFELSELLNNLLLEGHVGHSEVSEAEDWLEDACLYAWTFKLSFIHHGTLIVSRQCIPKDCLSEIDQ